MQPWREALSFKTIAGNPFLRVVPLRKHYYTKCFARRFKIGLLQLGWLPVSVIRGRAASSAITSVKALLRRAT
jgi:hypothetical protein